MSFDRHSRYTDVYSLQDEQRVIHIVLSQVMQYDTWKRPESYAPVDPHKRKLFSFSLLKRIRALLAQILKVGV